MCNSHIPKTLMQALPRTRHDARREQLFFMANFQQGQSSLVPRTSSGVRPRSEHQQVKSSG
eukprot:scaffold781_cov86-Skeletonema_menzelii.AAC.2